MIRMEDRRKKSLNLEEKEDRISDLPDCLLHHILSFLPSTEEAIRTCILSKRWKNQWTHVPILIFDSGTSSSDISVENFARFIDSTLLRHDCSKITKLHLAYNFEKDTNFSEKIRFATRKHVEELILHCYCSNPDDPYMLPEFLFDNVSLVRLEMIYCCFRSDWSVNWGSLKVFKMEGYTCRNLVANVLSGSSLLESLELNPRGGGGDYVIASKSLKILILVEVYIEDDSDIRITCPNLEELYIKAASDLDPPASLPDKTIENVVSCSPLLRSLELKNCYFEKLVIVSKSLKNLVLRYLNGSCALEISCPNLEDLNFIGLSYETIRLMKFPSLICAYLDFEIPLYTCGKDMSMNIFEQFQNVKELKLGNWFIEILSDVAMVGFSYPWSNNKILTLDCPNFEHLPGIVCALRSSPMLEKLVIRLLVYERRKTADLLDSNDSRENYWISNKTVCNCFMSHLRTVKIVGLSKRDAKCKLVLGFIEFVLKNARVLEKLVVMISKDQGKDFEFAVSQKVSSFPRCSQHAIVELLCCTEMDVEEDTDTDTETDTMNLISKA